MFSIIICSRDDAKFVSACQNYAAILREEDHEIIRVSDARSLSEGYNRGVGKARGSILVFSHDDIEILATDFAKKVTERLKTFDLLGIAGTTRLVAERWVAAGPPYVYGQVGHVNLKSGHYELMIWSAAAPVIRDIQALDGVILCARRAVLDIVRFDEKTFDGFHHYDLDFTFAAYLENLSLAVCTDFHLIHRSLGIWDSEWQRYGAAFVQKYQGILMPSPDRKWQVAVVVTQNKLDLIDMMSPPHWQHIIST